MYMGILLHMKPFLIELDPATARDLERVAPAGERRRSAFVRHAIRRALDAEIERRTEQAYRLHPQEPGYFDPAEWETETPAAPKPRKPRRK